MSFKTMNSLKSAVTYVALCLSPAAVDASGCGVVHYLENKSNGVEVTANPCKTNDRIAVGGAFTLIPGARLWIKSPPGTSGKNNFQAICQNRSAGPITLSVDRPDMPWIHPKQLSHCSDWSDNKLSCDGMKGEQNVLSCVIAAIEPTLSLARGEIERTTSVTMRGLSIRKTPDSTGTEFEINKVLDAIRPEAELCRGLYQAGYLVKIDWMLDTNGHVTDLKATRDAQYRLEGKGDAEQQFSNCVIDVVNNFPYPKPPQTVFLSARF